MYCPSPYRITVPVVGAEVEVGVPTTSPGARFAPAEMVTFKFVSPTTESPVQLPATFTGTLLPSLNSLRCAPRLIGGRTFPVGTAVQVVGAGGAPQLRGVPTTFTVPVIVPASCGKVTVLPLL